MMRTLSVSLLVLAAASASPAVGSAAARPETAQNAARPVGDSALMPADGALPGWKKTQAVRVFSRADLYGYIDGGAELFLEFGFDTLSLQKYQNGQSEVAVEIYRMTDAPAALGTYLMKCGKEVRDASFAPRHTINKHQLMFVRGRFYVTINNLSGSEGLAADLAKFGALVAAKLPAGSAASQASAQPALPSAGLVAGSERLVRGPFGLQAVFTFGDGDILQMGGKILGAVADYKDATGSYTLLLVAYPDAAAARKAFTNVQQNLDKYLKPVTTTADRLVFKDYENKFGVIAIKARQLEIRLHMSKQP
jgi:hypothetical protein